MHNLIIQNASKTKSLPAKSMLKKWVNQALSKSRYKKSYELVIRFVDTKESTKLNKRYRKKNQPTNVISFQFEPPPGLKINLLGDLVICSPLLKKEALLQGKTVTAHLAHLVIHGVLHLLGYDHKTQKQAKEMEALEISHLAKLKFNNPYLEFAPLTIIDI